jgi:hypothetical protein
MNVEYNNAGPSPKPETDLSPEEQAMNAEGESEVKVEEPSRRRPGCEGYVTVNESDAW